MIGGFKIQIIKDKKTMLKELLQKQQQYLDFFFQRIELVKAEELLKRMLACTGTIILSGVGKSGLVAEKIAVTLTSTGTKALYLSPTNALHGDIGIVHPNDLFIMLSKSGESEELLQLVPYLRNRKVHIASIVCNPHSRLSKASDSNVVLPLEKELCPFDLVPTTSTAIQSIFGDLLAVALMQEKRFGLEEYANNHPAGRIGKRITLKVSDLMLKDRDVPLCSRNDRIMDILVELSDKKCGCILVVDEMKKLLGIFTDGDLRRSLQSHGPAALDATVDSVMSCSPKWITPHELAWKAVEVMEADQKRPVAVLPVVNEEKKVLGLIKMHDIVQSGL